MQSEAGSPPVGGTKFLSAGREPSGLPGGLRSEGGSMKLALWISGIAVLSAAGLAAVGAAPEMKKWQKGKGWGWVWGGQDEVGSLNEMTDASRAAALRLARQGKVYDLG